MSDINKTCLSYWFPKIEAAGLPVPKTRIVRTGLDLTPMLEGETVEGVSGFLDELGVAAEVIGYPVFLRTGHGSAKHEWLTTCCVSCPSDSAFHVHNLVEWSFIVDLPTDVWAVREMLPTKPLFTAFRGMPICREFRVFVDGPEVVCVHPYWPREALLKGFPMCGKGWSGSPLLEVPEEFYLLYESLCVLPRHARARVAKMASRAGSTLGGKWSVDLIETERGWYLTDMAEAHRSFHWEGCPEAQRLESD